MFSLSIYTSATTEKTDRQCFVYSIKQNLHSFAKFTNTNTLKSQIRLSIENNKNRCPAPTPAEQINQGWSMDFLSDILLSDERKVRVLNVLDECSRKVLLCFAATSIKARKLVKLLQELIEQKGKPAYIRCGPECISRILEKICSRK